MKFIYVKTVFHGILQGTFFMDEQAAEFYYDLLSTCT